MSYLQILAYLAIALANRFGWLGVAFGQALDYLKPHAAGAVPEAALAAPDELKRAVVEFLDGVADKIPQTLVRLVVRRAIDAVPSVIDALWDMLFERQVVGASFKDATGGAVMASPGFDDAVPLEVVAELAGQV